MKVKIFITYSNTNPNTARAKVILLVPSLTPVTPSNMIHEIHSKNEQNPTIQPGTNVAACSYFEKYTEILKAIEASNIGKGTIRLSERAAVDEVVASLHPPAPSSTGRSSGQLDKHSP
jgi:hypothetical protein